MYGLPFTQSWVVIDVDTDVDLNQWEGCHQLCNPQRAGTYMRVSETRYRWEFQLLDGETAADDQTITDIEPPAWCRSTWIRSNPPCRCGPTRASGGQAVDTADRADVSAQRRASVRPRRPESEISSASIQALPHARMFREAMNRAVSPAKARLMRYPTAEAVN